MKEGFDDRDDIKPFTGGMKSQRDHLNEVVDRVNAHGKTIKEMDAKLKRISDNPLIFDVCEGGVLVQYEISARLVEEVEE